MKENRALAYLQKNKLHLLRLTSAAMCIALAMVLPFLTGQIPQIGKMMAPMHIPVLLCGLLCGWPYGLAVGVISPMLRCLVFGTPAFVSAFAMCFELGGYGFLSGFLFNRLPKKLPYLYLSLIGGMLFGRVMGFVGKIAQLGLGQIDSYSLAAFWSGYVTGCLPGIVLQIVLIPLLVLALRRAGLRLNDRLPELE